MNRRIRLSHQIAIRRYRLHKVSCYGDGSSLKPTVGQYSHSKANNSGPAIGKKNEPIRRMVDEALSHM